MIRRTVHIIDQTSKSPDAEHKDQICLPAAFLPVTEPSSDPHRHTSQKQCDHRHVGTWTGRKIQMKDVCHIAVREQRNQKISHGIHRTVLGKIIKIYDSISTYKGKDHAGCLCTDRKKQFFYLPFLS